MELKREIFELISEKLVIVLDAFIATHPHENHIGAMDDIIKNYDVKSVHPPKITYTTKTFEYFLNAVKSKILKIQKLYKGVLTNFDLEIKMEMLLPVKDTV